MPTISSNPNTNPPTDLTHATAANAYDDRVEQVPSQQTNNAAAQSIQSPRPILPPRHSRGHEAEIRRAITLTNQRESDRCGHIEVDHQQWLNLLSPTATRLLNDLKPEMKKIFQAAHFTGDSPLTADDSLVLADGLKALTNLYARSDGRPLSLAGNRAVINGAVHTYWEKCLRGEHCGDAPLIHFAGPITPEAKRFAENVVLFLNRLERSLVGGNESQLDPALRLGHDSGTESAFRHIELLNEDQRTMLAEMTPASRKVFCTAITTMDPALTQEQSEALSESLIAINARLAVHLESGQDLDRENVLAATMLNAFWETSLPGLSSTEFLMQSDPQTLRPMHRPTCEENAAEALTTNARIFLNHFEQLATKGLHDIEAAAQRASVPGAPLNSLLYRPLTLNELNLGGESPEQLITVPALGHHGLDQVQVPIDPASHNLRGRAYLEFLTTDLRLTADIATLI